MPTIKQHLTTVNRNVGGNTKKFIVVHNVGTPSTAAGAAKANADYFHSVNRNASAHYFIDSGDIIYQVVKDDDRAWHVGDGSSGAAAKKGCSNASSIGIEVCGNSTFTSAELSNLRWLVQKLMKQYGIKADHVVRHHDVSGKRCPAAYIDSGAWAKLHDFITASTSPSPTPKSEPIRCCIQAAYNATAAQHWRVVPAEDGFVKIVNAAGQCLDVTNGSNEPMKDGRVVSLHKDNGTPAQRWRLEENADGSVRISSKLDADFVLDSEHGAVGKRGYVKMHRKQEKAANQWAQSWHLLNTYEGFTAFINAKSLYALDSNPTNIQI